MNGILQWRMFSPIDKTLDEAMFIPAIVGAVEKDVVVMFNMRHFWGRFEEAKRMTAKVLAEVECNLEFEDLFNATQVKMKFRKSFGTQEELERRMGEVCKAFGLQVPGFENWQICRCA